MTTWLPDLNPGNGPLYAKLARSIETGIESGELPIGSKLPPQRNLAFDLGVTVGTVSRAYSIVRERGSGFGRDRARNVRPRQEIR